MWQGLHGGYEIAEGRTGQDAQAWGRVRVGYYQLELDHALISSRCYNNHAI
jgi:hypothetical protein